MEETMKTIFTIRAHNGQYEFNVDHCETRQEADEALKLAKAEYPQSAHIVEQQVPATWGKRRR